MLKNQKEDVRTRRYCFTYFLEADDRDKRHFRVLSQKKGIKYLVIGYETCPTTKRKHLQGFIHWKNAKTWSAAKRWFQMDKIHIVPAVASDLDNQVYCTKEETFLEIGSPAEQGKRSDISVAIDIIKNTNSISAVLDEVQNYQAVRHAELYMKYKETPRPVAPIEVIWLYGSSGCGKTRKVYSDTSNNVFRPINHKWWEGYDGHKTILIDDFRPSFCSWDDLLRLLDIYPFRVETKGGSRQVQFNKIYITTPYSPKKTYPYHSEDISQLTRRITHTINMDEVL